MSEPKPVRWADAPAMCPYCPHAPHTGQCGVSDCWCWLPESSENVPPSAATHPPVVVVNRQDTPAAMPARPSHD